MKSFLHKYLQTFQTLRTFLLCVIDLFLLYVGIYLFFVSLFPLALSDPSPARMEKSCLSYAEHRPCWFSVERLAFPMSLTCSSSRQVSFLCSPYVLLLMSVSRSGGGVFFCPHLKPDAVGRSAFSLFFFFFFTFREWDIESHEAIMPPPCLSLPWWCAVLCCGFWSPFVFCV